MSELEIKIKESLARYEEDYLKRLRVAIDKMNSRAKHYQWETFSTMGSIVFAKRERNGNINYLCEPNKTILKFIEEWEYMIQEYHFYMEWDRKLTKKG